MIVVRNNNYIVAYRNRKRYVEREFKDFLVGDISLYQPTDKDMYEFAVSGVTYKQKQQSAYEQCLILLEALKKYECSTRTLFMIVGWIERNASNFGLLRRLKKEGYKEGYYD